MRGWKKVFHANGNQKKARVEIFISDEIDFQINVIGVQMTCNVMLVSSVEENESEYLYLYLSIYLSTICLSSIYLCCLRKLFNLSLNVDSFNIMCLKDVLLGLR